MNYFLHNKKLNFHFIFLFILSLYYLIPFFSVGHLIVRPHDILDMEVVYNHVIGRIYRGDFESINLFIGGEFKWYFLRRILQPLTILYAFFETEIAFWLTDIFIKLTCYVCFFKLSKKLNCSDFNSALVACLFATSMDTWTHFGLGIATFPYLIYLVIKNKNLNLKHYLILAFIGLNTDLVGDVLILPLLLFISWILIPKDQKYNFKLFFKISLFLFFFILLSTSNMIYSIIFSGPFHRAEFIYEGTSLAIGFKNLVRDFFSIPDFGVSYFFHRLPFTFYTLPVILISLFSKDKKTYLIILIIFLIKFIDFILNLEFVANLRNSSQGFEGFIIKSVHWGYVIHVLPVLYGILFIKILNLQMIKKFKSLIFLLVFFSLITSQIRISVVPLGKHLISFENLNINQKSLLRYSFHNRDYISLINDIFEFKKNIPKNLNQEFKSLYTFAGYYNYENYKHIKSLVKNSRTISVGLDPMVAAINNIKVIDGYHNLYPLSYKSKFRKVIEEQLDQNDDIKKYYDGYGQRIYTFVFDPKIIKTNFRQAHKLGAEYVISKYPILNQDLITVCEKCNDSNELFLYKIKL